MNTNTFKNLPPTTRAAVLVALFLIAFGVWKFVTSLIPVQIWNAVMHTLSSIMSLVWPVTLIALGVFILWSVKTGKFEGAVSRRAHGEFMRSRTDKRLFGVCGGIAYYFAMDATIIRIMVIILFLLFPLPVLVAYTLMVLLVPQA